MKLDRHTLFFARLILLGNILNLGLITSSSAALQIDDGLGGFSIALQSRSNLQPGFGIRWRCGPTALPRAFRFRPSDKSLSFGKPSRPKSSARAWAASSRAFRIPRPFFRPFLRTSEERDNTLRVLAEVSVESFILRQPLSHGENL